MSQALIENETDLEKYKGKHYQIKSIYIYFFY